MDNMDLALQIPKVNPPHILSNFSLIVMALSCHNKPSRYGIPNHLEFCQLLKHHVLKIQVSPFSIHHFQSFHEKNILKTMALFMEFWTWKSYSQINLKTSNTCYLRAHSGNNNKRWFFMEVLMIQASKTFFSISCKPK